jgi:D-alanyl-lipoteichoic acid acyltransferase DltB (MBOAT superfamily)
MLFASLDFLLFLGVVFAGYWALAGRTLLRTAWCLAASYFFYAAGPKPAGGPLPTPWYFVGLLIASTLFDYVCGRCIQAARSRYGLGLEASEQGLSPPAAARPGRGWLILSLFGNLGLLGYFKYTGFLLEVGRDAALLFGLQSAPPALDLLLPVGISFYTFQSIAYTIDVYRGRVAAERNLLRYALFVAFFPQLVAGPIVRAAELLPQLAARPRLTREDVDFALFRILKGLVKKVVLGDFVAGSFADGIFAAPAQYGSLENLLALYAFTLQIYADFSGYSDIAIGVARLFGVRLPENFNRPYQAVDIADFWRRWHITLSTWLRDYVYYPLGGSRLGPARTYVNLWVTLLLVGLWHGASWNFVVYALLQGFAMVYNRYVGRETASAVVKLTRVAVAAVVVALGTLLLTAVALKLPNAPELAAGAGALSFFIGLLPSPERWPVLRPLHVFLTLHYCVFCRLFFRTENLEAARQMALSLLDVRNFEVRTGLLRVEPLAAWANTSPALGWLAPLAEWGVLVVMIGGFLLHYVPARHFEFGASRLIPRVPAVALGVGVAVVLGVLSLVQAGPRANIYFAF